MVLLASWGVQGPPSPEHQELLAPQRREVTLGLWRGLGLALDTGGQLCITSGCWRGLV